MINNRQKRIDSAIEQRDFSSLDKDDWKAIICSVIVYEVESKKNENLSALDVLQKVTLNDIEFDLYGYQIGLISICKHYLNASGRQVLMDAFNDLVHEQLDMLSNEQSKSVFLDSLLRFSLTFTGLLSLRNAELLIMNQSLPISLRTLGANNLIGLQFSSDLSEQQWLQLVEESKRVPEWVPILVASYSQFGKSDSVGLKVLTHVKESHRELLDTPLFRSEICELLDNYVSAVNWGFASEDIFRVYTPWIKEFVRELVQEDSEGIMSRHKGQQEKALAALA